MTRSSTSRVAVVLLAVVGAVACGGPPSPGGVQPAPAAPGPRPANPADVHFLNGMIHHHAQALVMARWAEPNGASLSIRTLSERIIVSQTDEIRWMQMWLAERGESVPEPSPTGMRMEMQGMEHDMLMPGMLSEAQMAELQSARGPEFDRLFLLYMIQHHEGALTMVEELFAAFGGGMDDDIYKLAMDTFADQGTEIDRMQRMLEAMAGQSP